MNSNSSERPKPPTPTSELQKKAEDSGKAMRDIFNKMQDLKRRKAAGENIDEEYISDLENAYDKEIAYKSQIEDQLNP